MGGGSSSPEYMNEIITPTIKPNKEKFENNTNNKYFLIIIGIIFLIFLYLFILFFIKKRYKD